MTGVTGEMGVVTVVVTAMVEEMEDIEIVEGTKALVEDGIMAKIHMMTDEVDTRTDLVAMMTGEASMTGMDMAGIAMEVVETATVGVIVESETMEGMEVEIIEMIDQMIGAMEDEIHMEAETATEEVQEIETSLTETGAMAAETEDSGMVAMIEEMITVEMIALVEETGAGTLGVERALEGDVIPTHVTVGTEAGASVVAGDTMTGVVIITEMNPGVGATNLSTRLKL